MTGFMKSAVVHVRLLFIYIYSTAARGRCVSVNIEKEHM